jgi:PAS domain S-box-containing protein
VWSFWKIKQRDGQILVAQAAQKEAYEELEKTFDAIDGIITIQDKDMRITRVNRATCEVFNAKPENLVGKYCYEVFRGQNRPCEGCPEIESLQDGVLHQAEIEHTNLNKIFSVSAVPITNGSGETIRLVHYAKDITESRRQERQLRQAQKMEAIGTLAGGIAHDFNNILTAIIGFSELGLLRSTQDVATHQDLDQIHQAGLRAKELVKQILTFSRQGEQDFQPLHIQSVVKEALRFLRSSIPTTITFEQDIAGEGGLVIADSSQIHQVVMNLCTNAYHAMRDLGGTLTVSLKPVILADQDLTHKEGLKPGPYLRLIVGDTGKGIKKEDLERIFEPYFTTKKKGEGTGLGLSLVHGIVRSVGGYISVYSEEGRGTTFQVYLPSIAADEVVKNDDGPEQTELPTGRERILIVDDEESIIDMEGQMLESLGYTVTAFSNPLEAKDAFLATPLAFDLLITDMNMPHLSGLDLVEYVKEVRPDMPIIISTGFSERINSKAAHRYGVKTVIMKPVVLHELAQVIRRALDQ